jgi:hypothetical protein
LGRVLKKEPSCRALEFLALVLDQEEYDIDFQKVQALRGDDTVSRTATNPKTSRA